MGRIVLNTLRKDGFLPYLLPRFVAGESERGEQAVIYQQPARRRLISWHLRFYPPPLSGMRIRLG